MLTPALLLHPSALPASPRHPSHAPPTPSPPPHIAQVMAAVEAKLAELAEKQQQVQEQLNSGAMERSRDSLLARVRLPRLSPYPRPQPQPQREAGALPAAAPLPPRRVDAGGPRCGGRRGPRRRLLGWAIPRARRDLRQRQATGRAAGLAAERGGVPPYSPCLHPSARLAPERAGWRARMPPHEYYRHPSYPPTHLLLPWTHPPLRPLHPASRDAGGGAGRVLPAAAAAQARVGGDYPQEPGDVPRRGGCAGAPLLRDTRPAPLPSTPHPDTPLPRRTPCYVHTRQTTGCFDAGMAYVAISRVRSLDGLRFRRLCPDSLSCAGCAK